MNGSERPKHDSNPNCGCLMCMPPSAVTGDSPYIKLKPPRAILQKWHAGQQKYGPEFKGDPLQHLYEELTDAANYVTVGYDIGELDRGTFIKWHSEIVNLMERVKEAYDAYRP